MSYRNLATKPLNAGLKSVLKRSGHIGLGISAFTPVLALANPTGGQVAAGQASIAAHGANGMVITQNSQSAIINWQQFSIGAGQYVQFLQPSSSSVVLNRVIGGSPSSILGSLTANGQVFLVNTNGVYFGKGSSIDAQGFLASTLGISNQNFLAHDYVFNQAGAAGATVVNDGNITAHRSGYVVLAGDYAENDGIIAAQSGHVILASGAKATLSLNGNSLINFAVNQSTLANYAGVKNTGSILADGGTVVMTADVANLLKSTVVNNTGLVEAQAISNSGGVIQLLATGGNIQNAGTLDASGAHAGQAGGAITLKGDERTTLTNTSNIDTLGQGARGGSVEVSGNTLSMRGLMNIGKGGKLLLDPNHLELVTTGGTGETGAGTTSTSPSMTKIGVDFIETHLNSGAAVAISAHALIDASTNVHTITATKTAAQGGGGQLTFNVSHPGGNAGGAIQLAGVDIDITGELIANMGYGSFGHLTAGDIEFTASNAVILAGAVKSKGKITVKSAVATSGEININAPNVFSDSGLGSGGLVLSAKTGVDIDGHTSIAGNLTMTGKTIDVQGAVDAANVSAVASNGYVQMGDINATGTVTVTANIGAGPSHSGGFFQVGHINANGNVTLVKNGGTSHMSIGSVEAGAGNIAITATMGQVKTGGLEGNNITVTANQGGISAGYASANGVLTMTASAEGNVHFSNPFVLGRKGVVISGFEIANSGNLEISAPVGGVTLNIGIGQNSGTQYQGNVFIDAYGGAVKLGKGAFVQDGLTIQGASLAYTGAGSQFTLSAGSHLELDASIGTAKAPVKYGVDLVQDEGQLVVTHSIFVGSFNKTAADINITAHHGGSSSRQGMHIGDAEIGPITLSAKGNVNLTASDDIVIGSGDQFGSGVSTNIKAGKTINVTAQNIVLHPERVEGNVGHNTSITLTAGSDIDLTASDRVSLQAGEASASLSNGKAVTQNANLTLTAGGNVKVDASQIEIEGGEAFASASESIGAGARAATANANLSITATHGNISFGHFNRLSLSNGYGEVEGSAGKKETLTLNASATVSLKAGGDIDMGVGTTSAASSIRIAGGGGNSAALVASGSHAVINSTIHTDVSLIVGGGINMKGHDVHIGSDEVIGRNSGSSARNRVIAKGTAASVTLTDTGVVTLQAGIPGINLTAFGTSSGTSSHRTHAGTAEVKIGGGANSMGFGFLASGNAKGKVAANISGGITINTKGDLNIQGGNAALISAGPGISEGNPVGPPNAAGALASVTAKNGGAATINITSDINVSAQDVILSGGAAAITTVAQTGFHDAVTGNSGAATLNIQQAVNVTAVKNVSLTVANQALGVFQGTHSGSSVIAHVAGAAMIAGGGGAGSASLSATHAGKATLTVSNDINVKAGGNVTLDAADDSLTSSAVGIIQGGNSVGFRAREFTGVGGGAATLTATAGVTVTAKGDIGVFGQQNAHFSPGTVGSANGGVQITAGSAAGAETQISAQAGGKATITVASGVSLAAGGSIALGASANVIKIEGGSFAGGVAQVSAVGAGAAANLNVDASVSLTGATGIFTHGFVGLLQVNGGGDVGGRSFSGSVASNFAFGKGAKTTVTENVGVSLTTTATNKAGSIGQISLGGFFATIEGGSAVGSGARNVAHSSGAVTANYNAGVNLKATNTIDIGGVVTTLHGGRFGGGSASASHHGVVKVSGVSALNITAAKGLSISGSVVDIAAGGSAGFSGAAINGGSANVKLDQSVNITAASVTVIASAGALNIHGGDLVDIEADALTGLRSGSVHYTAGKFTGSYNAGVNIKSAGDVKLTARTVVIPSSGSIPSQTIFGDMNIRAGQGEDLFVGIVHIPSHSGSASIGNVWHGGTVTVSGNASVSITAGGALTLKADHDLNVGGMAAGHVGPSSSLAVVSQATVRGGSSHAVANVTLLGAVTLTAKTDVDLSIGNNASVNGGSLGNFRADHASGKVTILGSADAIIHAGRDVNLDIGGSLTIAGEGANASHGGFTLADAHANQGTDVVTVHGDASISAVRNIGSVSSGHFIAGTVGKGLNIVAGQFIDAAAIGAATNEKTLATGNATLAAGGSLNINVLGDLNVLGGLNGSAEVKGSGDAARSRSATMQARANLTAGKNLTLNVSGDGFIAGGDSLKVALTSFDGNMTAVGSGDVSANIKGGNVSITVAKGFFMRAGGSNVVEASASGGLDKATATGNADATITATGTLSLTMGTVASGSLESKASFIGGNINKANVFAFGSNNVATATMHGDVLVTAGGAMTITDNGALKVASGPGGESGGVVLAGLGTNAASSFGVSGAIPVSRNTATATETGAVSFTAGTNLTVTATDTITILGGSHLASNAFVQAVGSDNKANLTVNDSVVMKATKGALSVAGTNGVTITTKGLSGDIITASSNGTGGSSNNVVSGKVNGSVTLTGKTVSVTPTAVINSAGTFSSGGVIGNLTVNIGPNLPTSAVSPRGFKPMVQVISYGTESLAPRIDVSSFGQSQPLSALPTVDFTAPALTSPVTIGGVQLTSGISDLGTLQSQSLVTSLVTLLGQPEQPQATSFMPLGMADAFPSTCSVLVVAQDGQQSCHAGGR